MEHNEISTVSRQLKRTLGERTLNDLGRATRLCRRERAITPFRLAVSLIESFAGHSASCIADIQRAFNALCSTTVRYKPFHNQLAKKQFPKFMQALLSKLLNELACDVLRIDPNSPFVQFDHIRIQDGTAFALKPALAGTFPGRFTTVSPAAVELHADFDLLSETMNQVVLSPDSSAERQFLPAVEAVTGGLLLADRGYFARPYFEALDAAGGHFIVRAGQGINPLILSARGANGRRLKRFDNQRLKAIATTLKRFDCLDMIVQFDGVQGPWTCRLVVHPNLKGTAPRYLITNLDAAIFTPEHVSDAYRLRWQVELLFKEWKSYANLRAFDTANPHIAEGLIWAALLRACHRALVQRRYLDSHRRQVYSSRPRHLTPYTHTSPVCAGSATRTRAALLGQQRAKPHRDPISGRLKLGLQHVHVAA